MTDKPLVRTLDEVREERTPVPYKNAVDLLRELHAEQGESFPLCGYGCHSWIRYPYAGSYMKQCTNGCGGVYGCTEKEWQCLTEG